MLFSSLEFVFLFLPITFFVYFYLISKRLGEAAKIFLVIASLFFYGYWNPSYLPLILGSMVWNFAIGSHLTRNFYKNTKAKVSSKTLLIIGILGNLGLLGYFKYADFFILNTNFLFKTEFEFLELALPLAISFFTFQQISYLVDSYRGETSEYDFFSYALFVSFFPQLIAGPIVHHKEMMPQFSQARNKIKNYHNILLGMFIFSIGFFKKVVIADTLAFYATTGFDESEILNFYLAWQTSLCFTFQIYFDFSGYCDMAIGAALLFNIKIPINFNSPLKSCNMQEFWYKWHITLGRFLRDYVYIPLGGSKKGSFRTYINLFATMLIGGIWHGASWLFVLWGALHGLALIINKLWQLTKIKIPTIIAWFITFNFLNFANVFFRATSFDDAFKVLKGMFGFNGFEFSHILKIDKFNDESFFYVPFYLILSFILVLCFKNSIQIAENKNNLFYTILFCIIFSISVLFVSIGTYTEFIYFNF